jgi:hypothetical protein
VAGRTTRVSIASAGASHVCRHARGLTTINGLCNSRAPVQSPDEREVIATFVSAQNHGRYCQMVHDLIAAYHLHHNEDSSFG